MRCPCSAAESGALRHLGSVAHLGLVLTPQTDCLSSRNPRTYAADRRPMTKTCPHCSATFDGADRTSVMLHKITTAARLTPERARVGPSGTSRTRAAQFSVTTPSKRHARLGRPRLHSPRHQWQHRHVRDAATLRQQSLRHVSGAERRTRPARVSNRAQRATSHHAAVSRGGRSAPWR